MAQDCVGWPCGRPAHWFTMCSHHQQQWLEQHLRGLQRMEQLIREGERQWKLDQKTDK